MELDYIRLKEIKPALSGYIREAKYMIRPDVYPDETVVHDVRVLMKKSRATLRLTSSQMNSEFLKREAQALREVGRIMCPWRETSVLRKTLKELKKARPDIFLKLSDDEKIKHLLKKPEPAPELTDNLNISLNQIADILNKTSYRIRFEQMHTLDPQLLLKELEATYKCVVSNYLICRNNPKASNLHEFRKRSKDFLYQLWFFRPLNISVVKALEKKLDVMTQSLGKYNDLDQLLKMIGYKYNNNSNQPELDELAIIIREAQDRYLSKVWTLAYRIFCPGQILVNLLGFKLLVI
jgi:CHAD domain-containing protein